MVLRKDDGDDDAAFLIGLYCTILLLGLLFEVNVYILLGCQTGKVMYTFIRF